VPKIIGHDVLDTPVVIRPIRSPGANGTACPYASLSPRKDDVPKQRMKSPQNSIASSIVHNDNQVFHYSTMFRRLILLLLLQAARSQSTTTAKASSTPGGSSSTTESKSKGKNYKFDQDAAGLNCEKVQNENDEETFRLFCINQNRGFKLCSISCSSALYFEGTVGACKPHRCSFYGNSFKEHETGKSISMAKTEGKVTLFALIPTWEAEAQYFYELLEEVRSMYNEDTTAFVLPIFVDDEQPFEIAPLEEQDKKVTILQDVLPENLMQHPFLMFVQTLSRVSGFATFDVYTDRPVIFAVSADGNTVERMVSPTLATLEQAILKYGKAVTTKEM
jgi:hypothetical protein